MRFDHPSIIRIADAHKREQAQIFLRWGLQHVSPRNRTLYKLLYFVSAGKSVNTSSDLATNLSPCLPSLWLSPASRCSHTLRCLLDPRWADDLPGLHCHTEIRLPETDRVQRSGLRLRADSFRDERSEPWFNCSRESELITVKLNQYGSERLVTDWDVTNCE